MVNPHEHEFVVLSKTLNDAGDKYIVLKVCACHTIMTTEEDA